MKKKHVLGLKTVYIKLVSDNVFVVDMVLQACPSSVTTHWLIEHASVAKRQGCHHKYVIFAEFVSDKVFVVDMVLQACTSSITTHWLVEYASVAKRQSCHHKRIFGLKSIH